MELSPSGVGNDRFPPVSCSRAGRTESGGRWSPGSGGAAPGRAGGGACELGDGETCDKTEKGAVEGAEAARGRGRAGSAGLGASHRGHLSMPTPLPSKPQRNRTRRRPHPRKKEGTAHLRGWLPWGCRLCPVPPPVPFTCPSAAGAAGRWVAVEAACDRCPPLTALGTSPVAPCHWLSAADRQGCSL